jgi:hypothetical protein
MKTIFNINKGIVSFWSMLVKVLLDVEYLCKKKTEMKFRHILTVNLYVPMKLFGGSYNSLFITKTLAIDRLQVHLPLHRSIYCISKSPASVINQFLKVLDLIEQCSLDGSKWILMIHLHMIFIIHSFQIDKFGM